MEKMKVTDELLRDAFLKLSDELLSEWEKIPDTHHKPSQQFKKKMKKLIGKTKNRELCKEFIKIGKVAAAFFIVIGAVLFGSTLTAKADPHLYFKKMEVILNDAFMYVYDSESQNNTLTFYEPTYVPEGYEEVDRMMDNTSINIRYKNSQGESIVWDQMLVLNTTVMGVDSEYDAEIETQYAGENVKMYIYKDKYKYLVYESGNCVFKITATNLTVEDMYKMIKDMKKIEE